MMLLMETVREMYPPELVPAAAALAPAPALDVALVVAPVLAAPASGCPVPASVVLLLLAVVHSAPVAEAAAVCCVWYCRLCQPGMMCAGLGQP